MSSIKDTATIITSAVVGATIMANTISRMFKKQEVVEHIDWSNTDTINSAVAQFQEVMSQEHIDWSNAGAINSAITQLQ